MACGKCNQFITPIVEPYVTHHYEAANALLHENGKGSLNIGLNRSFGYDQSQPEFFRGILGLPRIRIRIRVARVYEKAYRTCLRDESCSTSNCLPTSAVAK
jgi:hypothetical protein